MQKTSIIDIGQSPTYISVNVDVDLNYLLSSGNILQIICNTLRALVLFVKFKKLEKHPWESLNFSKLQAEAWYFTKSNTPYSMSVFKVF